MTAVYTIEEEDTNDYECHKCCCSYSYDDWTSDIEVAKFTNSTDLTPGSTYYTYGPVVENGTGWECGEDCIHFDCCDNDGPGSGGSTTIWICGKCDSRYGSRDIAMNCCTGR